MTYRIHTHPLTPAMVAAMVDRRDLLARESALVADRLITWRARLAELGDYGCHGGGSPGDRRRIVEAMAALEAMRDA